MSKAKCQICSTLSIFGEKCLYHLINTSQNFVTNSFLQGKVVNFRVPTFNLSCSLKAVIAHCEFLVCCLNELVHIRYKFILWWQHINLAAIGVVGLSHQASLRVDLDWSAINFSVKASLNQHTLCVRVRVAACEQVCVSACKCVWAWVLRQEPTARRPQN